MLLFVKKGIKKYKLVYQKKYHRQSRLELVEPSFEEHSFEGLSEVTVTYLTPLIARSYQELYG